MKIKFWEDVFKVDSTFLFGTNPNKTVTEYEHLFEKNWSILDVGCGDGKNSIYLANRSYKVDAFDISETAISKIKRISERDNLKINTQIASVENFEFEKRYDLIMSFGVFHFVNKEDWKSFVKKMKDNTNVGGVNIIQIFTDDIPPTPDIAPYAIGMAKDGEIKELYANWEIIEFSSYTFEEEHQDFPLHKHASNKLVARKKV
mgnify:CR=1 FL=1